MASALGQFLHEEDLDEAMRLAKKLDYEKLDEYDKKMVTSILDCNWDEEHLMVSNLLHAPHIIPKDVRLKTIIKGLREEKQPYYALAAATGITSLKLDGAEADQIIDLLKNCSTHQRGTIAIRAFMTLAGLLKHPQDTDFVVKFMHKANSNLRYNSLDWLIANVRDKNEIIGLLQDKHIPDDVRQEAIDKVNTVFLEKEDELQSNDWTTEELHHYTFVPNLAEFEAMLTKEQTLAELFTELDTNKDGLICAKELKEFCDDIGQDISLDQAKQDIALVDTNNDGKIDKDEWVELMFPKFNIQ
ncbi:uncharacterized protein LOC5509081 isoform X2 [Nematostella vectensis]|uniref:uncharacterized protein LOC5509081 isoform X2 n=1 Tax=Nematostella vectensis TaxID=45351 RepID=UPI0013901A89|nr:uncharacterized protein LOC5509081 isoform X2 [Nematostella vectensis]